MAESLQQTIIIKRVKGGGGHAGSHGAWKVAYADFTTAMMSFFLLLWLLNVTTSDQRQGIADYFAPASVALSNSGAGGAMGGKTITAEGAMIANGAPPTPEEESIPTAGKGAEGDEDTPGKNYTGYGTGEAKPAGDKGQGDKSGDKGAGDKSGDKGSGAADKSGAGAADKLGVGDAAAVAAAMKREEERFKQAEEILRKTIGDSPELKAFSNQILFDRTTEGLRIQIVDQDKSSMFPSGSSLLYEKARDLLKLVGRVISRLPNHISVTGHTDSAPFTFGSRRDNWDLSTERANVSRAELVKSGVDESRVERVVGLADRDPLIPTDPKASKNRRISIVLLRQALPPASLLGDKSDKEPIKPPMPSVPPAPVPIGSLPTHIRN